MGLPTGQVRGQMAHGYDRLPAIADLCGVPLPEADIDGKSLVGVIHDTVAASPHDVLHWQLGTGELASWAMRQGPWKLLGKVRPPADGPELSRADRERFLVNLDQDVSESRNLAGEHPQRLQQLEVLHAEWVKTLGRRLQPKASPHPPLLSPIRNGDNMPQLLLRKRTPSSFCPRREQNLLLNIRGQVQQVHDFGSNPRVSRGPAAPAQPDPPRRHRESAARTGSRAPPASQRAAPPACWFICWHIPGVV